MMSVCHYVLETLGMILLFTVRIIYEFTNVYILISTNIAASSYKYFRGFSTKFYKYKKTDAKLKPRMM